MLQFLFSKAVKITISIDHRRLLAQWGGTAHWALHPGVMHHLYDIAAMGADIKLYVFHNGFLRLWKVIFLYGLISPEKIHPCCDFLTQDTKTPGPGSAARAFGFHASLVVSGAVGASAVSGTDSGTGTVVTTETGSVLSGGTGTVVTGAGWVVGGSVAAGAL